MALAITRDEWKEISLLPEVQKAFEWHKDYMSPSELAEIIYGAKFVLDNDYTQYTLVGLLGDREILILLSRANGVFTVAKSE